MAFRSEDPPHSRLFVLCQKGVSEKDFREKFGEYGKVEDIWIVKDKRTNEDRGIVYVKFGKTSEALLAMEEMNGRCMSGQPKPLKVVVANSKRDGSTRDPREEEKLVRLFVICPKTYTEKDLRDEFEKFGDLDHVTVIRDRSSGESKGFGYVKYHRPYHAALAFENCDQLFKPKFAEPQRSRDEREDNSDFYNFGPNSSGSGFRGQKRNFEEDGSFYSDPRPPQMPGNFTAGPPPVAAMGGLGPMSMLNDYPAPSNCCRIQIVAPIGMTQGYLTKLFNLIPGMEYCDLNESTGVAYARYATPQCASYARDKLHGFEYPIGSQLMVQLAEENVQNPDPSQGYDSGYSPGRGDDPTDLRQRAASLLEKAGINPQAVMALANSVGAMGTTVVGPGGNKMERVNYCNILLPLPQPLVPDDSSVAQRLFIVCQPSAVSERVLRDAFSRFGNLIDVFLLSGRNYGYAKFANKEAAMRAIQTLHGQNLSGQRIKVLEAEPPKGDDGPAKKQKV
ncbi:RNA-binding protein 45-like [Littorina saxatilis]|uniref:RRM domain-containing protein n=1 Tax=Littorina saxatilis TaxID=31220 RepID=A0AAN9BVM0_9CAEN